jgi:hypothetical protein
MSETNGTDVTVKYGCDPKDACWFAKSDDGESWFATDKKWGEDEGWWIVYQATEEEVAEDRDQQVTDDRDQDDEEDEEDWSNVERYRQLGKWYFQPADYYGQKGVFSLPYDTKEEAVTEMISYAESWDDCPHDEVR